jgi:hypothetical protein
MATPKVADAIVETIANDTNTPMDTVSRIYDETWAEYSAGARIMHYLPILVARRVRDNLRRCRQDPD